MQEMHLKWACIFFTAVGLWPLTIKRNALRILYNCYFAFCVLMAFFFIISLYVELNNLKKRGVKALVTNVAIVLHFSFNLLQAWSTTLPMAKLLIRKIQLTEENTVEKGTSEVKMLLAEEIKRSAFINKLFAVSGLACDVTYTIAPWISKLTHSDESKLAIFPLEFAVPFDKFEYYKTAYLYIFVGGMSVSLFALGSYFTYVGMMQFVLTQFKILKHEIMTGVDGQLKDYQVKQNIRKIVIFYNNIITFTKQLNGVIKYLMLLAGAIFIEQIAIVGFQLATEDLSVQLVKSIVFMNWLMLTLIIYYWLANEITLENYSVSDAIWNSDWFNCSKSVKRSLILIIMRSQRPLQLTVGPFYFMSNETMLQIMKSSVSYAIALRKFSVVKAENALSN